MVYVSKTYPYTAIVGKNRGRDWVNGVSKVWNVIRTSYLPAPLFLHFLFLNPEWKCFTYTICVFVYSKLQNLWPNGVKSLVD